MKKIKFHQLQQSNRLIIQSIRLELNNQQSRMKKRGRLSTLPDQHSKQIFRSKKKKCQLGSIRIIEPHHENYSIPLKLNRWQTLQQQEMKRIKSNIVDKNHNKSIAPSVQQVQINKQVVKIGSLIFVKEMLPDSLTVNAKQKRKNTNLLKFKSFKGVNSLKIKKSKQYLTNDLAVSPMKISIDLPRLKSKNTEIFRHINRDDCESPCKQIQKSLLLDKAEIKKIQKPKPHDLSPWSTKGQIFNPSESLSEALS